MEIERVLAISYAGDGLDPLVASSRSGDIGAAGPGEKRIVYAGATTDELAEDIDDLLFQAVLKLGERSIGDMANPSFSSHPVLSREGGSAMTEISLPPVLGLSYTVSTFSFQTDSLTLAFQPGAKHWTLA